MRIVFVSTVSTPLMHKFCNELNKHCDAYFLFYEEAVARPGWWQNFARHDRAVVLEGTKKLTNGKYINTNLNRRIDSIDPDILILGGFFNISNWLAYKNAKKKGRRVFIFSEKFRGTPSRPRANQPYKYVARKVTRWLYSDIDLLMGVGEISRVDFIEKFQFPESKVVKVQYPVDMQKNLAHELRYGKRDLTFLFPHRLIRYYDPGNAVRWFAAISDTLPDVKLNMNAFGPLRKEIEILAGKLQLRNRIQFLDAIRSWDDLNEVYRDSDIILSTKTFILGRSDWSIAEMEAAASGMGFITTEASLGLADLLTTNNSGFLIADVHDTTAVVAAAKAYFEAPALLVEHGKKNRREIKQFSVEETAKKWATEYFVK